MVHKTTSETKAKAVDAATRARALAQKLAKLQTKLHSLAGEQAGSKSKPLAVKKGKSFYGTHKPSAMHLHEAGVGLAPADIAKLLLETPREDEEDLSAKLVSQAGDASDVNALCKTYQLKREELGRLTGFSLRALAEWASGKLPSQPAKRRLHEVRRLLDALAEIVKVERIPAWLHERNAAFDNLTPLQVIELGEIDRLWAMVHDLGSGQPS